MNIADKIRPASAARRDTVNLFVYGAPGTGKTWLVGSAAKAGLRVLLLDAESGAMTVRDTAIDVLPLASTGDLRDALRWLLRGDHGYDVVALDSLTEIQRRLVADQGKMSQQKWGEVIQQTGNIVRAFRDLPCSSIVLALSKEIEIEEGESKRTIVRPSLSGKSLPHEVSGYFDVVGYSEMGHVNGAPAWRLVTVATSDRIVAKDRSGTLDRHEPNDFAAIYRKITGSDAAPTRSEARPAPREQPPAQQEIAPSVEPEPADEPHDAKADLLDAIPVLVRECREAGIGAGVIAECCQGATTPARLKRKGIDALETIAIDLRSVLEHATGGEA